MVITRRNAVHALLYLIVSLLSIAAVIFSLGAPFIAALEVIIVAGAIMVLFIFVAMMINPASEQGGQERNILSTGVWIGPSILAALLFGEFAYVFAKSSGISTEGIVEPKQVGISLFGPYMIGVELASMLLLAGLIGAYHLGNREQSEEREKGDS